MVRPICFTLRWEIIRWCEQTAFLRIDTGRGQKVEAGRTMRKPFQQCRTRGTGRGGERWLGTRYIVWIKLIGFCQWVGCGRYERKQSK